MRGVGGQTCFDSNYFEQLATKPSCQRNWYEGTSVHPMPHYHGQAPAVLGFDKTIMIYCLEALGRWHGQAINDVPPTDEIATTCVAANKNVLRLMNGWNICENFHWMVCAARGDLPGQQHSRQIEFSLAPGSLDRVEDLGTINRGGYQVNDVYYLEICLFAHVCKNGDELFGLRKGAGFVCDLQPERVRDLASLLA